MPLNYYVAPIQDTGIVAELSGLPSFNITETFLNANLAPCPVKMGIANKTSDSSPNIAPPGICFKRAECAVCLDSIPHILTTCKATVLTPILQIVKTETPRRAACPRPPREFMAEATFEPGRSQTANQPLSHWATPALHRTKLNRPLRRSRAAQDDSDLDCVFSVRCLVNTALAHRVGTHTDVLLHLIAVIELEVFAMQLLKGR